jgi:diguanylate cyclase (GGDEF)-like protein
VSVGTIALVAALVALVATAVVAVAVLRSRRRSDARLSAGLREVGRQMEGLAHEFAVAVEKVREDALRVRVVESLGQPLDLDEVLTRSAEAASALPGVTAAVVDIGVGEARRVASAGIGVAGGGLRGGTAGPPDGSHVRAIGISYHYPSDDGGVRVRSAISVPIDGAEQTLGFLTVYGATEEPPVTGGDFATLEEIARQAGSAVESARARATVQSQEPSDTLTGLAARRELHESLSVAVARAHRHGERLSLCILDLDDFSRINRAVGAHEGDVVLTAVADALRSAMGATDEAFRCGGDAFGVILHGAGRIDAEALAARVQAALTDSGALPGVTLSSGVAELKPDDDGLSLFERTQRALHWSKSMGRGVA